MITFSIAVIIFYSIIWGIGMTSSDKSFSYALVASMLCAIPIIQALFIIFGGK